MSKKSLQIERIAEAADLEKLKEIWNALLERNATRTVELTYEWQMTYWKHFNQNAELFVLVVKADETVIALAPLKLTQKGLPGIPFAHLSSLQPVSPIIKTSSLGNTVMKSWPRYGTI
jgi:hypothetical protein